MAISSEENAAAKRQIIGGFFDAFTEKVAFTERLFETGHRDEAILLCCAYIDGMGTYMGWPLEQNKRNFVHVLLEHSGVECLALVHPGQLIESIQGRESALAKAIKPVVLQTPSQLLTMDDVLLMTRPALTAQERARLPDLLWMGTLAAIVYTQLRVPYVHHGGGSSGVVFSNTSFRNNPAPRLDYELLREALRNIVAVARSVSEQSGKWFGHDFKSDQGDTS